MHILKIINEYNCTPALAVALVKGYMNFACVTTVLASIYVGNCLGFLFVDFIALSKPQPHILFPIRLSATEIPNNEKPLSLVSRHKKDADVINFVQCLKSIAKESSRSLNEFQRQELFDGVIRRINSMESRSLSTCVWALGCIGCKSTDLNTEDESKLILGLSDNIGMMMEIDRLKLVYGLGRLGFQWQRFPQELQLGIMSLLASTLPNELDGELSDAGRQLATILYAFGQMGVSKTDLLPELWDSFCDRLCSALSNEHFSSQGFANSFWGLERLGYKWDDFSPTLQELFIQFLSKDNFLALQKEFCSVLHSFSKMQVNMGSPFYLIGMFVTSLRSPR